MIDRVARERWLGVALSAALVLLQLGRLGGFPLQEPDEGRYAEIAREMLESGDWITPRLNYVVYFEKPPLFYWLLSASMSLFGRTEAAVRLVSALAALGTLALVFLLGRSLFGRRAALLATGLLATMPLFFAVGQFAVIDMPLTFFTTATLAALWGLHADPARSTRWTLAVALAAALGTLAKGPVALVLPGAISLIFLVWQRDGSALRALLRPLPLLAYAAVVTPWFVLISRAQPEFLEFFFVREHLQRFAGPVGHPESVFYYVPTLLLGTLPWIALCALAATPDGRAGYRALPRPAVRFLCIWFLGMFAFFSAANSKLATYLVPALPPLALLLGAWVDACIDSAALARILRRIAYGFAAFGVAGLVAASLYGSSAGELGARYAIGADVLHSVIGALMAASLALGLGSAWALRRTGHSATRLGVLVASLGLALFALIGARGLVLNARQLGETIAAQRQPGDAIVGYRRLFQGLGFYTGSRMIQVMAPGETKHGMALAADREQYFWQEPGPLVELWRSGRGVFIATERRRVAELLPLLEPAPRIEVLDRGLVLLTNRPEPDARVP